MNKFENYVLITDLDGTLLCNDGTVSHKDINAIEYFKNNGGKFSVATGRTVGRTSCIPDLPELDLPGIFANGAVIANLKENNLFWKNNTNECVKDIIYDFHIKNKDAGIIIFSEDKDYFINPDMFKRVNSSFNGFNYCEANIKDIKTPFYKVVIISFDDMLDFFNKEYSDYLDRIYFTKSNTYFYEIMDNSINKGIAVNKLRNISHIHDKKIIAVGDNLNDLEFIETADIGVAVLNDCDKLIKKADITVEKENAIYKLISKIS